jgi:hypothetical protein
LEGHVEFIRDEGWNGTVAKAQPESPSPQKTEKLLLLTQQCVSCEWSMSCEFMCCVHFKPNDQPGATFAVVFKFMSAADTRSILTICVDRRR